jgi:hypothetical protein
MTEPKALSVMALTQAFVAADSSFVQVHLSTPEGPLVLQLSPRSLGQVVARLTEMDSALEIQIGSTTGHVETQASDVQTVMAQEAVGGSKVIVSFRTSAGRIHSFGLSLEQVQQLRVDARKAEGKAREQASKSRN